MGLFTIPDDIHSALGGWSSSTVEEAGNRRSEAVTAANRIVTYLGDKEEPAIVLGMLFTFCQILHSLAIALAIDIGAMPLSD